MADTSFRQCRWLGKGACNSAKTLSGHGAWSEVEAEKHKVFLFLREQAVFSQVLLFTLLRCPNQKKKKQKALVVGTPGLQDGVQVPAMPLLCTDAARVFFC